MMDPFDPVEQIKFYLPKKENTPKRLLFTEDVINSLRALNISNYYKRNSK